MNPKTPLPWSVLPCYFDNQCQAFEPQDADFMLEACNQFPKLSAERGLQRDIIDALNRIIMNNKAEIETLNHLVAAKESEITRLRQYVNIGPGIE